MALTSPGVEVVVIDESQYIPSAVNSVPYFLVATAQNKVSGDGVTVAAGTTAANANRTYLISSQRDLVATFGVPFFYSTATGTPINGYELNEYGLLAAYSALGVTNRAYVQRVDVDLTEITASLSRPLGEPNDGTYWLDTSTTTWGIQEWNQSTATFTVKTPIVITDTSNVVNFSGGDYRPLQSIGSIGDYAVSAVALSNPGYYKNTSNQWVQLGFDDWKNSWPTVTGTGTPLTLTAGWNLVLNGISVAVGAGGTALTVAGLAQAINNAAIAGVTAAAVSGRLAIFTDSQATADGSTQDNGAVDVEPGNNQGAALLAQLGIVSATYRSPEFIWGYSYQVPRWRTTDAAPSPTGSVWANASSANNGLSVRIKRYDSVLGDWIAQTSNAYINDETALAALDPANGGRNIPVGTTYVGYNSQGVVTDPNENYALSVYERIALGPLEVTGTTTPISFVPGDVFRMGATQAGSDELNINNTITIGGTGTVADFIAAVSGANIPYVSASVNSAGNIVFTHSQGGTIYLTNFVGTPITAAGFTSSTPKCRLSGFSAVGTLVLSNFVTSPLFTYTASATAPQQNPADGRLWYYSSVSDADIMIKNNGIWAGYQLVNNDARGFDLSLTNRAGPIISPVAPTTQTDTAQSPLQFGDLWIDSSDLENYPKMYRWEPVDGTSQWVAIDTTDQITQNGVLFADTRWGASGAVNPASDPFPTIESLAVSNYIDLDAPDVELYPEGILLFNTRRSGYNVKSFDTNYFTQQNYPDAGAYNPAAPNTVGNLPLYNYTWVTASGNRNDGAMWSGRLAQRQIVVQALKAGIDTNAASREEQNSFNLLACPGYPELTPNMIALGNERSNTLFVVGDTPMRLDVSGNSLVNWATNNGGQGLPTEDGLIATSNYAGVFYPSCQTTDLSGSTVVAPPSHMMVRTILRSDAVSYPWFAPAGTRRGVVDNALAIGYIDALTGEFQQLAVSQATRDILYERSINPITFIPGVGITNFGNKTSTAVTTALDRINVARLVAFLRGRLEEIGKLFLFEPNDEITRNEIANTVNSLMIDLIAKRAIYDYLVVCDLSNNTPARIDRNELWVDIAIEPVKAVEFIYIPLRIKNTGEIAAGN